MSEKEFPRGAAADAEATASPACASAAPREPFAGLPRLKP